MNNRSLRIDSPDYISNDVWVGSHWGRQGFATFLTIYLHNQRQMSQALSAELDEELETYHMEEERKLRTRPVLVVTVGTSGVRQALSISSAVVLHVPHHVASNVAWRPHFLIKGRAWDVVWCLNLV